jgi:F-type H+-transporting ATPase subunit epsilon
MLVSGGFVEVNDVRVSVLADLAERPDEIDATQARQERESAEKALGSFSGSEEEMAQMRARLDRAAARLELSSGR